MKDYKLLPFLLVVVFSACQSLNNAVKEPKVSLNSVHVAGISLKGVDLVVHIDVENPNSFTIPLPNIDWELFINTSSFIRGNLKNDQSIKRQAKVTLDLPVSVTYEGLYNSIKSLFQTKEAAYNVALGISFPLPIIADKVYHLEHSGVIPLPQLPKLNPGEMKISKIDFSGVALTYSVNVENPNRFPIPFPKLNWDYAVNGVPVIKSNFTGTGEIAAGAAGAALIGVSVAYADVFRAVESLRNAGESKSNLSLGFNPADTGIPLPPPEPAAEAAANEEKSSVDIQGILPILQMPEVSFQGIAKKSLGTTMEFILSWEVENKNTFDFDIGVFNYDFRVNNNAWAQGRMDNLNRVKSGSKSVIPLTVSISAISIVRELVDIINRGTQVDYSCTGNMSFMGGFPGMDKLELPLDLRGSTRIR